MHTHMVKHANRKGGKEKDGQDDQGQDGQVAIHLIAPWLCHVILGWL